MNVYLYCLLLVLVGVVNGMGMGFNKKHGGQISTEYNPERWMEQLKDTIYHQSLLDITIPGTHDSGAYVFSDEMSPVESKVLDDLIKICNALDIDIYGFIKNWSLTQDTTIYEQLMGGIRYLDLRACYINNDWYTQHFLVGTKTQDLLDDVKRFMTQHRGEVLVLELGELIPPTDELILVKMINKTLGKWLAPRMDLSKTTIGEMVEKDQRIVLLYPESTLYGNFTWLWNKTKYMEGSYANKDKLADMEQWNIGQINQLGGDGKIFELSWTLTTQDSDIVKTLLDPFLRTRTLRDFALEADAALGSFAQQYHNYMLGNILLVDFWENSGVVPLAVGNSLRNCHDDHPFKAEDASGVYCRSFFEKGLCTDQRYADFMANHCRLSCGIC